MANLYVFIIAIMQLTFLTKKIDYLRIRGICISLIPAVLIDFQTIIFDYLTGLLDWNFLVLLLHSTILQWHHITFLMFVSGCNILEIISKQKTKKKKVAFKESRLDMSDWKEFIWMSVSPLCRLLFKKYSKPLSVYTSFHQKDTQNEA